MPPYRNYQLLFGFLLSETVLIALMVVTLDASSIPQRGNVETLRAETSGMRGHVQTLHRVYSACMHSGFSGAADYLVSECERYKSEAKELLSAHEDARIQTVHSAADLIREIDVSTFIGRQQLSDLVQLSYQQILRELEGNVQTASSLLGDQADLVVKYALVTEDLPRIQMLISRLTSSAPLLVSFERRPVDYYQIVGQIEERLQAASGHAFPISDAPELVSTYLADLEQFVDQFTLDVSRIGQFDRAEQLSQLEQLYGRASTEVDELLNLQRWIFDDLVSEYEHRVDALEFDRRLKLAALGGLQLLLILFFVKAARNVEQLARAQQKEHQTAEDLQFALDRQEHLFAIIGHELRTPAASIKMLLDEYQSTGDKTMLAQMQDSAVHLMDVLDDMKAANSGISRTDLQEREADSVYGVMTQVVASLRALAKSRGVMLLLRGKPSTALGHLIPRKGLRQILLNLTKNAVLHSESPVVELILNARVDAAGATEFEISIVDQGKGIDPSELSRLFSAYERGDTEASGTGLGLYICAEIAEKVLEGSLRYEPNQPQGSRFVLFFELNQVQNEAIPEQAKPDKPLDGVRILFAEDTATLRMLSTSVLERVGALVSAYEDGAKALEAYRATDSQFDLVITDIMMPNLDGYGLASGLRAEGYSGPIYGVTGATVGDESSQLLRAGADRVFAKPLPLDSVLEAIFEDLPPVTPDE